MHQFRDSSAVLYTVKLSQYESTAENIVTSHSGWGELPPGEWHRYTSLAREVPHALRRYYANEWVRLQQENAPLRAVVNGVTVSAEADFYDPFLRYVLAEMEVEFFEPLLICKMLTRYQFGIGDTFIAQRIQMLIDGGALEVVRQREDDPLGYRRDLRKKR